MFITVGSRALLLGTAVACAFASGAHAAPSGGAGSASDPATQAKIQEMEQEIQDLSAQIQDLKRSSSNQYADVQKSQSSGVKVSIDNGRPTIASADGRFTASIRALGQLDAAYYMQGGGARELPPANGPDLSSGVNFRRVYLGVQGKVFGDWSYNINFDFGGSNGTEQGGRIQSTYVQYDGLAPWAFRVGAYPPPAGLEDSTSAQDTIFLERTAPSDVMRNTAAGDGRDAATILYAGDRIFGAVSYTAGKVGDGAVFDEQSAAVGRLTGLAVSEPDAKLAVSAEGTWVFKAPDATQFNDTARNITLSAPPELTVDSTGTKLVTTGGLNVDNVKERGLEAGGFWQNLFAQAGWFNYQIDQRVAPPALPKPDLSFSGWYAEATWIITGESHGWNQANGAFTAPRPAREFHFDGGGWGAWELAARYSDLDLNDHTGSIGLDPPYGGVRGGEQKIFTAGVNWYPNTVLKFSLDYQHIDIDRLNNVTPFQSVGQTVQAISIRSQISL